MPTNFEHCGIVVFCVKCFLFISFCCLTSGVVLVSSSSLAQARSDAVSGRGNGEELLPNTVQNVNQVIDYLLTLKRTQDEIFRKIDSLTKTVEEKDHEGYKFRLKFSRKVHTLENKVLSMEQAFTQKVEEVVQKKLAERSRRDVNPKQSASGSSVAAVTPKINSHGHGSSLSSGGGGSGSSANMNIQNHQPSHYLRYQSQPQPYHRNLQYNQSPYQIANTGGGANWGFYEHPITHKRVRSGNMNMQGFGFEPPTRNLQLISLVATAESKTSLDDNIILKGPTPTVPSPPTKNFDGPSLFGNDNDNDDDDGSEEIGTISFGNKGSRGERNGGRKRWEELQKNFESLDGALQTLKGNVTNLEKEMTRNSQYQSRTDIVEIHKLLVDNAREINVLHQKDQEMIQRIEHFIVEIEKVAAKREHSVNGSLKDMASEVKKQVNSLKAYTKRQVQNITNLTSSFQPAPDKLRCAQTLLDELLFQMNKQKPNQQDRSPALQTELSADQAESTVENGDDRFEKLVSYASNGNWGIDIGDSGGGLQKANELSKELQLQRTEIMLLKSELGRLNISQILLKRTVDEETLKRKVRPRDCAEIRLLRNASSGVYSIFPNKNDVATEVFCDMVTEGGGWTVIQRRGEPNHSSGAGNDNERFERVSFDRNWDEYEKGFGSFEGDFWLGLSTISTLCKLGIQELRIELTDWSGVVGYANYQYFKVSNSSDLYRLQVGGHSGTVGDSLTRHSGMAFSTPDKDNDVDAWRHCAKTYNSGWWYYACFESNLNGSYQDKDKKNASYAFGTGIIWEHWKGSHYSLKRVEMKIRNTFVGDYQYAKMFPTKA